jgi:hypothetical protein
MLSDRTFVVHMRVILDEGSSCIFCHCIRSVFLFSHFFLYKQGKISVVLDGHLNIIKYCILITQRDGYHKKKGMVFTTALNCLLILFDKNSEIRLLGQRQSIESILKC